MQGSLGLILEPGDIMSPGRTAWFAAVAPTGTMTGMCTSDTPASRDDNGPVSGSQPCGDGIDPSVTAGVPVATKLLGGLDATSFSTDVQRTLTAYGETTQGVRRAHIGFTGRLHDGGRPVPSRAEREDALNALLAPGATRSAGAGRRAVPEDPDPVRTCFERDLDRIKHHVSFRRLAGKCQVFIAPEDIHLRTRMTHSLEVAQVALSIAAAVGANTALAEAAALGHDCGHGPMGHASEEAFTPYLDGGYDHAPYGAHVMLADANLCAETIDAIASHSWRRNPPATVEGEIVSFADRIAYVCHDFDDAVRAGIVSTEHLPTEVRDVLGDRQSRQLRALINDVIDTANTTGIVGLSAPFASALDTFRAFNYEHIYLRQASRVQGEKAIDLLRALVDFFVDHPGRVTAGPGVPRAGTPESAAAAVHHVAQMTDAQTLDLGLRLLGWERSRLPRGA